MFSLAFIRNRKKKTLEQVPGTIYSFEKGDAFDFTPGVLGMAFVPRFGNPAQSPFGRQGVLFGQVFAENQGWRNNIYPQGAYQGLPKLGGMVFVQPPVDTSNGSTLNNG